MNRTFELTEEKYFQLVATVNQSLGFIKACKDFRLRPPIILLEEASKILVELLPEIERDKR